MGPSRHSFLFVATLLIANLAFGQQIVQPVTTTTTGSDPEPSIIEGGGVSIQPWYWLTSSQPLLRPGAQSTAVGPASLDFPGKARGATGFTFSVPAGKQNTLRFSYFRAHGSGQSVATTDLSLSSVGYTAGDVLATDYKLQNVKLSWDYLSYTFKNKVRFKTLWEAQLASVQTTVDAPLKAVTVDSNGLTSSYLASGTKWLVYPTFGIGFEQAPSKRFRWEAKGSGFGVLRRAAIWDIEAAAIVRLGRMEMLAGEKAFSLKTSPRADAYYKQTLSGPFIGIRWYLDRME
jgi:hypothetical protein